MINLPDKKASMLDTIKELYKICESLNSQLGYSLKDNEKLQDLKDLIDDNLEKDCYKLLLGINQFDNKNLLEQYENYAEFYYNILSSMSAFSIYFDDFHEVIFDLNKKKRYKEGEITLEEYLDDGIIELEDADDDSVDELDSV